MCNGHKIPPLSVQTKTKGLFKQAVIRLTKTRPVFTSDAKCDIDIINGDLKKRTYKQMPSQYKHSDRQLLSNTRHYGRLLELLNVSIKHIQVAQIEFPSENRQMLRGSQECGLDSCRTNEIGQKKQEIIQGAPILHSVIANTPFFLFSYCLLPVFLWYVYIYE